MNSFLRFASQDNMYHYLRLADFQFRDACVPSVTLGMVLLEDMA